MEYLDQFIQKLNETEEVEGLSNLLIEFSNGLGFFMCMYCIIDSPTMTPEERLRLLLGYSPPVWVDKYLKKGYLTYDHAFLQAFKRNVPYEWEDLKAEIKMTPAELDIFDDAAAHGLKFGINVPVHGPDGETVVYSFAADTEDKNERKRLYGFMPTLHLAGLHFHERIRELGLMAKPTENIKLSDRERDCILWASRGKTAWESAQILGISENTVNTYVKSAMAKLGVNNRQEAIAKSIAYRFVDPYDPDNISDTTSPLMGYRASPD